MSQMKVAIHCIIFVDSDIGCEVLVTIQHSSLTGLQDTSAYC